MPFTTHYSSQKCLITKCGSLLVVHTKQILDVAAIDQFAAAQTEIIKAKGHVSVLILVTIQDSAVSVPEEVKKKSAEMVRAGGKNIDGTATVIFGKGFGPTLIRTFMAGWALFSKAPSPQKTFATAEDARQWLSSLPLASDDVKKLNTVELLKMCGIDGDGHLIESKKAA